MSVIATPSMGIRNPLTQVGNQSDVLQIEETIDALDQPCIEYQRMSPRWDLIEDLLGGTIVMRERGEKWLPRDASEDPKMYTNRLNRSFLFEAFKTTIDDLASKPFSRDITIQGEDTMPPKLKVLISDIDGQGMRLTQFAHDYFFKVGLTYGLAHGIVEYPPAPEGVDPSKRTLADQQRDGDRTYVAPLHPRDLIYWRTVKNRLGAQVLEEIRFVERRTVNISGKLVEEKLIRVYRRNVWGLYRLSEVTPTATGPQADEARLPTIRYPGDTDTPAPQPSYRWVLESSGPNTLGYIPLVTFYTNRTGFLTATPPLEALAWLNLDHWQNYSQQSNILHFARVPMLFVTGLSPEEIDRQFTLAAYAVFKAISPTAKLSWIEHSGKAISSGKEHLEHIEARMEILGLKPMIQRTGNTTATARAIDQSHQDSELHEWVRNLESVLLEVFIIGADWEKVANQLKLDGDTAFATHVFDDFALSMKGATDLAELLATRKAGQIDHETYLTELRRRGTLAEQTDISTIIGKLKSEAPPPEWSDLARSASPSTDGARDVNPDGSRKGQGKPEGRPPG